MKKEFKRNPVFPIIFLIPGILFGVTTLLQLAMGNPVAFLTLIASILFVYNSIWQFNTPIISIDNKLLSIKEALLKQREVFIDDIEKIEVLGKNSMEIHKKDKSVMKVRLDSMKSEDRAFFKKLLPELIREDSSIQ